MVELFSRGDTTATFRAHTEKMRGEIDNISNERILGADIKEWTCYYFDNWKIQPLCLFLDNITQSLSETRIEKYNEWHDSFRHEPRTLHIDGFRITFAIPFDGDSSLLYLRPSRQYLTTFRVDSVVSGNDSSYGEIIFSLEYTRQQLQGNDSPDFAASQFEQRFKLYIENINTINAEVNSFNESLHHTIQSALEHRKKKATDYVAIGEKLSISLTINPNAPSTIPVLLKKIAPKKVQMPTMRPQEKEYAISSSDYENIRRIISLAGYSMEKTARTYTKLDEEELRDILISHLNTHYQGTATGETFSKVGKTDIHIPFENKAAYIAECKIWSGEKNLQGAINQLFSYMTWRDVKVSVIIFNKNNKDFKRILTTLNEFLNSSELCRKNIRATQNEWLCEYNKTPESTEYISVQIIIFDLFVCAKSI